MFLQVECLRSDIYFGTDELFPARGEMSDDWLPGGRFTKQWRNNRVLFLPV